MVNIEQDGERVGKWGEYIDQEKGTHGGNSLIFAHECNRLLAKEPNQKQEHFFEWKSGHEDGGSESGEMVLSFAFWGERTVEVILEEEVFSELWSVGLKVWNDGFELLVFFEFKHVPSDIKCVELFLINQESFELVFHEQTVQLADHIQVHVNDGIVTDNGIVLFDNPHFVLCPLVVSLVFGQP